MGIINATQPDLNGGINDILRKWEGDTQGYPYAIGYYNNTADASLRNKLTCVRYDGAGCLNVPELLSSTISTDAYHHIVFIKSGTSLKFYINNELVDEGLDNTSCTTSNSSAITVGSRGNLLRFFKGKVDDLRFYNRALSESEIELLFNL